MLGLAFLQNEAPPPSLSTNTQMPVWFRFIDLLLEAGREQLMGPPVGLHEVLKLFGANEMDVKESPGESMSTPPNMILEHHPFISSVFH